MKKIVLILFLVSTGLYAQRPNQDRMKAFKTAYLTEQLDLTSSEAEKFWPIYNYFDNKLKSLRKKERSEVFSKVRNGGIEALTDSEAIALIDKMLEMKTTELQYRKELVKDLLKVLSPKKIIKLNRAEEEFKKMLLERLKQHRGKRN
ncbi:MAG: sensor of ECF-type sigma factor [Bacteroidetes bacterium]|nr:sensor of ECF-type sigma factor [Bacteroidota bacterium]